MSNFFGPYVTPEGVCPEATNTKRVKRDECPGGVVESSVDLHTHKYASAAHPGTRQIFIKMIRTVSWVTFATYEEASPPPFLAEGDVIPMPILHREDAPQDLPSPVDAFNGIPAAAAAAATGVNDNNLAQVGIPGHHENAPTFDLITALSPAHNTGAASSGPENPSTSVNGDQTQSPRAPGHEENAPAVDLAAALPVHIAAAASSGLEAASTAVGSDQANGPRTPRSTPSSAGSRAGVSHHANLPSPLSPLTDSGNDGSVSNLSDSERSDSIFSSDSAASNPPTSARGPFITQKVSAASIIREVAAYQARLAAASGSTPTAATEQGSKTPTDEEIQNLVAANHLCTNITTRVANMVEASAQSHGEISKTIDSLIGVLNRRPSSSPGPSTETRTTGKASESRNIHKIDSSESEPGAASSSRATGPMRRSTRLNGTAASKLTSASSRNQVTENHRTAIPSRLQIKGKGKARSPQ